MKQPLLLFSILLLFVFKTFSQEPVVVGFLLNKKDIKDEEIECALNSLQKIQALKVKVIDLKKIEYIHQTDVLWYHKTDTAPFPSNRVSSEIKKYVSNGGSLLLTLDAARYPNYLEIEPKTPEVRHKLLEDKGYGRKAGFHGFRQHGIFTDLFGGAYVLKPDENLIARLVGYFDDAVPENGKVVAVDWDYIFIRDNSKLIIEHEYGEGKIISVGAYTLFCPENRNRKHLELFLKNTLEYLVGKSTEQENYFWNYKPAEITEFDHKGAILPDISNASQWEVDALDQRFVLKERFSSEDYWDVAGERMLVMGKEHGGIDEVWAHPFMALRDYEAGISFSYHDTIIWLNDQRPQIEVHPGYFKRIYKFKRAYLTEWVAVSPDKPAAVLHYEYRGVYPAKMLIKYSSNFRYMWPYPPEALGSIYYHQDSGITILKDETETFACITGSNKTSDTSISGGFEIDKSQVKLTTIDKKPKLNKQNGDDFLFSTISSYDLEMNDNIDFVICAGNEGVDQLMKEFMKNIAKPESCFHEAVSNSNNITNDFLSFKTPDSTFNESYHWSLIATDRFLVHTPGIGKSLVAGYSTTATGWDGEHEVNGRPGYGWYFGRDGQWSGFALLNYGDFEKVRSVLELYQDYQDLTGKIYHELTTSGVVHYDASDATPLYVVLAGRYLKHSGDTAFIRKSWPCIKKAIDYCFSTDTDHDHLIENTNVGHGWVEGGGLFGSHTSLYLASCWEEALENAAYIAGYLKLNDLEKQYLEERSIVSDILLNKFWNEDRQFFYQGIYQDGNFHKEPSLLSAIPLYFQEVGQSKSQPILDEFASNYYTSDWGSRIVSEESPYFRPIGYHTGSVWPLFTGWSALAEYKNNRPVQGFSHIMNNIQIYKHWGKGFTEEVLNGSVYKPSGVCPHQCWSETMVLQPAIEGMLGYKPDALAGTIHLSPALPANWENFKAENIRIGNKKLDFSMTKDSKLIRYRFETASHRALKVNFSPVLPAGTDIINVLLNGIEIEFDLQQNKNGSAPHLSFDLYGIAEIDMQINGGIAVLPHIADPKPLYPSKGFRIINAELNEKVYSVEVQGKSESEGILKIYHPDQEISSAQNGTLKSSLGGISWITVAFEKSDRKYIDKTIIIEFK